MHLFWLKYMLSDLTHGRCFAFLFFHAGRWRCLTQVRKASGRSRIRGSIGCQKPSFKTRTHLICQVLVKIKASKNDEEVPHSSLEQTIMCPKLIHRGITGPNAESQQTTHTFQQRKSYKGGIQSSLSHQ